MNESTKRYLSRTGWQFRPLIGLAAAAATAATLGLAVVTPAALPHTDPGAGAAIARHSPGSTEVAILPGTIEVVGRRVRTARAESPYLPAAYRPRG
jgi:hypothetical protein